MAQGPSDCDDPDHRPDPGRSPKSEIRIHWIIEKVPSGLRSKLQLICIAKIIQQFYYVGVRRRSVLSEQCLNRRGVGRVESPPPNIFSAHATQRQL